MDLAKGVDTQIIYRGHSKSPEYKLVPTALRDVRIGLGQPIIHRLFCLAQVPPNPGHSDYNPTYTNFDFAEKKIYTEFSDILESQGHSFALCQRNPFWQFSDQGDEFWPSCHILPVITVAQHFGLPTRLLDWTTNPLVAVYFAAIGACQQPKSTQESNSKFSVVVFRYDQPRLSRLGAAYRNARKRQIEENGYLEAYDSPKFHYDYLPEIVKIGAFGNENMKAQRGLFTIIPGKFGQEIYNKDAKGYEHIFELMSNTINEYPPHEEMGNLLEDPFVVINELSTECAIEALDYVGRCGVDGASLFPGPSGACKQILDKANIWRSTFDW